jgi:small conductance mechanosensitive channel
VLAADVTDEQIHQVCGVEPDTFCRWVLQATGNEALAKLAKWFVGWPLSMFITIALSWVIARLGRRIIRRTGRRFVDRAKVQTASPLSKARVQTLVGVVASVFTVTVWTIAIITILANLGVSIVPLLASAGVATAALGFGAQNIVKDFLAGFFMLAEGQFEVGDTIDVGEASGTVEAITLRRTQLRAVDGTVWHVPNGVVQRVGNRSQQWSQAVLDLRVAPDADLVQAQLVMESTAVVVVEEEAFKSVVLSPPEVWGVEQLGPDGAVIRLVVKTAPGQQWTLLRELRLKVKEAFDREGIPLAGQPAPRPSPVTES